MTEQSELMAWLEELEAEQASKALVIASLRQKLGMEPGEATPSTPPVSAVSRAAGPAQHQHHGPLRADTFFGLSIPEAIKKYLAIMKRPQSPRAITDALQQGGVLSQASNFYLNVSTALKRLRDSGVLVNTKEGWGLSAWYPNRKAVEAPKPKSKKKRKGSAKAAANTGTAKSAAPKAGPTPRAAKPKTGWHDFLAASLKEGRSMKDAAADWKLRKAAS